MERRERLRARVARSRARDLRRFLADEVRPQGPPDVLGKPLSRQEREAILGHGARGIWVVDSAAIVAVLLGQPGYEPILRQLAKEPSSCTGRPRLTAYSQFLYVPADVFWQSWMSTPSGSVQFEIVRPDCWFSNAS